MKEPELLELISEIAQEQEQASQAKDAESWDLYTQGKLDDAQLAALVAETTDEDPELLKELYRPLDEGRVDAMVDAVLAELPEETSAPAETTPDSAPGFLSFFKLWQLVPVGAAAAFLFTLSASPIPAPDYQLEVAGQSALVRGEAAESMKFDIGNRMVLTLRPDAPVETDVFAASSLKLSDGTLVPIDARVEVSATGAIQLAWTVDWDPAQGEVVALVVAVTTQPNSLQKSLKALKKNDQVKLFEEPLEINVAP